MFLMVLITGLNAMLFAHFRSACFVPFRQDPQVSHETCVHRSWYIAADASRVGFKECREKVAGMAGSIDSLSNLPRISKEDVELAEHVRGTCI